MASEKKLEFNIQISEKEIWDKIFLLFLKGIPEFYFHPKNKVIPYVIARLSLINKRITLLDAKKILKFLCDLGYLIHISRRGYRINWKKIEELVNEYPIFEIAKNNLNFVTSPTFESLIYHKAINDTKKFLKSD
jgi:hypothetical protein